VLNKIEHRAGYGYYYDYYYYDSDRTEQSGDSRDGGSAVA